MCRGKRLKEGERDRERDFNYSGVIHFLRERRVVVVVVVVMYL